MVGCFLSISPDPRSIAKSLRVRAYQVRDLPTIHNGSGISSGRSARTHTTRSCPESFSLGYYLKLTKKIVRYHLILSYNQSQAINKNKLLDKSQKTCYTWQVAGDGG